MLKQVFGRMCHNDTRMNQLWFEYGKIVKDKYPHVSNRDELQELTCASLHEVIQRDDKHADLRSMVRARAVGAGASSVLRRAARRSGR